MKRNEARTRRTVMALIAGVAACAGCAACAASDDDADAGDFTVQIAALRAATDGYADDPDRAEHDGFSPSGQCIEGMGRHFINNGRLLNPAAGFRPDEPTMLLFDGANHLVGVEWGILQAYARAPPAGFAGDADEWLEHAASCHYDDGTELEGNFSWDCPAQGPAGGSLALWHPGMWALHVYLWVEDDATDAFSEYNERVTCDGNG